MKRLAVKLMVIALITTGVSIQECVEVPRGYEVVIKLNKKRGVR